MRAALTLSVCCLLAGNAAAQATFPTIEELISQPEDARTAALRKVRGAADGMAALRELETAAGARADARQARGLPPLSTGCLLPDEFDLVAQLRLARQAASGAEFSAVARQYHEMRAELDAKLAETRRTNEWRRHFPSLKVWEREWRGAREPRTRELLLRTLSGQAIRASLVDTRGKRHARADTAPRSAGKARRRHAREEPAALTLDAYREYVFNLMCAEDERNLRWFKQQIAEIGWFGARRYGWAADRAALLLVQHADVDPAFQAAMAAELEQRLATRDTDPENLAYLIDRVAVRAGRPQRFGTQMECVSGEWVVPKIEALDTLDARRERMNLVAYDVQMARSASLCRN